MGKLITYAWRIAVQLLLLWSCGSAQVPDGFLSIDCGSPSTTPYNDANNILWTSDADLMTEGDTLTVANTSRPFLNTMRLFRGNQSKYCYRLKNSAVEAGAFFLVRASFWTGSPPPYTPKSSDGLFRFKLLIDADEWHDVNITRDSWMFYEIYTSALRNSIDFCLARSAIGDDPFISALELRPLPSNLAATHIMSTTSLNFISINRDDPGTATPSFTRYPNDSLDRFWLSNPAEPILATSAIIDTSEDLNIPPVNVLQTAFGGTPDTSMEITWTYSKRAVNGVYYCLIYFAEIDPRVNASGQRVFNIEINGEAVVNLNHIDVFAQVGADKSYEIMAGPISVDQEGKITFSFSGTALFPPFFAAAEFFLQASSKAVNGTSSNDVIAIDDLKGSMSLSSYTGDPCLPKGFAYSWLNCDTSTTEVPRITSISLSNHLTGGKIPETINTLTLLDQIFLDGNDLHGSIPNMSGLTKLQTLDLSNNKLNGSIPESLATLKSLKVLNLANNNLTGEIPAAFLQRQQESPLDFNLSGNPLCENSINVACTLPPPSSSSKSKHNIGLIVGVVVAVLFVVIIGVALTLFYLQKNKTHSTLKQSFYDHSPQQEIALYRSSNPNSNSGIKKPLPMLSIQEFTFQEIEFATNNFNTQIGQGGFGSVYKGTLKNGSIVAIKVSSNSSYQGSKEFLNEVDLLSRTHHKNLVGLLGFCNEGTLILVYEFMSKGSLFDCLHGEIAKDSPLSWSTRLRILVDSAQGLDYLHHGCNPRIIHRDIKSSNILLNDKLEAKISDFGISRSSFINDSGAPPTALMGSMGYFDPQYLSTMRLTEKVDVYSFGVVLFEVLCGRRAVFMDTSQKQTHIVEWIRPYIDRGVIDDIVDVALQGNYSLSSIWKVLDVAFACVEFSGDQRPSMSVVYLELKEALSMELERDQSDMFNIPPPTTTFKANDYDALSFTHVHPR